MILLDTNTVLYYFKGIESVVRRLQTTPRQELRIPSLVAYELEYGTLKIGATRRLSFTRGFLDGVPQIPFDSAAATETVHIRLDLERRGLVIGPIDLMIAGCAMSRQAILITHNTDEFSRVRGLRLQDWTK